MFENCNCPPFLSCICGQNSSSESEHELTSLDSQGRPGGRGRSHTPRPKPSKEPELVSNTLHAQGVHLSNWLDNPHSPNCTITPIELTLEQIKTITPVASTKIPRAEGPDLKVPPTHRPSTNIFNAWALAHNCANEVRFWSTDQILAVQAQDFIPNNEADEGEDPQDPAQLMAGIFKDQHDLGRLEHIFAINVQAETRDLAAALYGDEQYTMIVPYGNREYYMLLGSCVGRALVRGMLAAWPRGTKEIARVGIWHEGDVWSLRFDVERVKKMKKAPALVVANPDPPSASGAEGLGLGSSLGHGLTRH